MKTPKAYTAGYEARKAGAHPADNPYTRVKARRHWNDGWAVADQEIADEEAEKAQARHHTVETYTQAPPTVVVQNEAPPTLTHWQKATNLREIPCPQCGKLRRTAEGTTHHAALGTNRVGRHVAYVYCRECDFSVTLPVKG